MLVAFLLTETRAAEPVIPLVLFRDPIISICSVCAFVLGMGMFGVIIYLPLFMQGVLGVSATQSGNLLTPLMMGAVDRQHHRRTDRLADRQVQGRRDRRIGPGGRRHGRLRADGSGDAADVRRLRDDHRRPGHGPAAAGLHDRRAERRTAATDGRRDLVDDLLPVDWQHRRRRGVRLDHAHALSQGIRAGDAGARARRWRCRTSRIRCCWCRSGRSSRRRSAACRAGPRCSRRCSTTCAPRSTSGLHLIFVCSAVIMVLAVPLHLLLRSEPLRTRVVEPELAVH